ncbi:hypothetical protein AAMO2058_000846400 [Amorphochlora amoebiformis]
MPRSATPRRKKKKRTKKSASGAKSRASRRREGEISIQDNSKRPADPEPEKISANFTAFEENQGNEDRKAEALHLARKIVQETMTQAILQAAEIERAGQASPPQPNGPPLQAVIRTKIKTCNGGTRERREPPQGVLNINRKGGKSCCMVVPGAEENKKEPGEALVPPPEAETQKETKTETHISTQALVPCRTRRNPLGATHITLNNRPTLTKRRLFWEKWAISATPTPTDQRRLPVYESTRDLRPSGQRRLPPTGKLTINGRGLKSCSSTLPNKTKIKSKSRTLSESIHPSKPKRRRRRPLSESTEPTAPKRRRRPLSEPTEPTAPKRRRRPLSESTEPTAPKRRRRPLSESTEPTASKRRRRPLSESTESTAPKRRRRPLSESTEPAAPKRRRCPLEHGTELADLKQILEAKTRRRTPAELKRTRYRRPLLDPMDFTEPMEANETPETTEPKIRRHPLTGSVEFSESNRMVESSESTDFTESKKKKEKRRQHSLSIPRKARGVGILGFGSKRRRSFSIGSFRRNLRKTSRGKVTTARPVVLRGVLQASRRRREPPRGKLDIDREGCKSCCMVLPGDEYE